MGRHGAKRSESINILPLVSPTASELSMLSGLWVEMVRELNIPGANPDRKAWEDFIKNSLLLDNFMLYYVVEGKEIIGFSDFYLLYDFVYGCTVECVNHLYIKPEYRGWIGHRICQTLLDFAKENKAKKIMLITWASKLEYWKSKGFKEDKYLLVGDLGD